MLNMKQAYKQIVSGGWWLVGCAILLLYRKVFSFDGDLLSDVILTLMDTIVLIGCSLLLRKVLIPLLLYRKRVVWFILTIVVLVAVSSSCIRWLQWVWFANTGRLTDQLTRVLDSQVYQLFNSYLIVFLGSLCMCMYTLLTDQWRSQSRYAELQREKAQTELSFLKAQINPHFLFNSINSIFAHIDRKNTIAREMLLTFSDLLRYQLYECNAEFIAVEKEAVYLQNYVDLQRRRKGANLSVSLEIEPEVRGFFIAPLLLIPFVENAFKYVSNYDHQPDFLRIKLLKTTDGFLFSCVNSKERNRRDDTLEDGGIGINNVKRRLELIYPDSHTLRIREDNDTFYVNLTLEL